MLLAPELHYDKLRYLLALIISDNSGKLNPGKLKFREVTIDLSQDAQVLPPAEDARGDRAEPHPPGWQFSRLKESWAKTGTNSWPLFLGDRSVKQNPTEQAKLNKFI